MRRAEKPIPGAPKLAPGYFYRVRAGFLGEGIEVQVRRKGRILSARVSESCGYYDHEGHLEDKLLFHAQMAYGKAVERAIRDAASWRFEPYVGDHLQDGGSREQ